MPGVEILLLAGVAVALGAVVQGAVGFGVAVVAAPFIILLDPSLMPGSLLVVGGVLSLLVLVVEHDDVDWQIGWALLGRVFGTLPGLAVVATLSAQLLSAVIAVMVLLAAGLTVRAVRIPMTRASLLGAGAVSGVTGTAASIGGPPLALVYQREDGPRLRSTLSVFGFVGAALSLVVLAVAGQVDAREALTGVAMIPFLLGGFAVSIPLRRRLNGNRFRIAVLLVVSVSAVAVLVRAVFFG